MTITPNAENALVKQKDAIIGLVNDGNYEKAIELLDFVKEMWIAVGYEYKIKEIKARVKNAIFEHMWVESVHWKTKAKFKDMLEKAA